MPRFPTIAVLVAALLLATLPAPPARAQTVGNQELFQKSTEIAQKALEVWGVYDDPEALRRVADIGYRVARHSGFADMPFTFHLIDMAAPNALALPGGQIFVTRGMLDLGLDDDMLASLLGHEIAHVALHHQEKMQKKTTLVNVLSQALLMGVVIAANNNRPKYDGYPRGRIYANDPNSEAPTEGEVVRGAAAASLVLGELLLRGYSREHEDEADQEGQRWAAAAGFDPAGTQRLMAKMASRLPQSKEYGYLQTHPFLDDRAQAARARSEYLKAQTPKESDTYRQRTQASLLTFSETTKDLDEKVVRLLEDDALIAWPEGPKADSIRLARLHETRDEELAAPIGSRDYGAVVRAYREQIDAVSDRTPDSELIATLTGEVSELESEKDAAFEKSVEVFEQGVYETAFLETFLSNWPDAPQVPRVALALGDAYSRLQLPTDAVSQYLTAWRTAPETEAGQRARTGLRNLAPDLDELAALQKLADQDDDPELRRLASERLAAAVTRFDDLRNGAEYLKRFPEGPYADDVSERINTLAAKLYNEVVLYRAVGDTNEALERINEILTHAPLSPAARQLRDQAVLEG